MYDGDRHGYITFGWVATIIGVLLFFAILESKHSDAQKSAEYAYKCAEQHKSYTPPAADVTTHPGDAIEADSAKDEQADTDWCDLAAQQSMAESTNWMNWAAWAGVIFTVAGVFLVWRTLIATQDTVAVTRKIGEAQTRAYLSVLDFESEVTGNPEPKITVKITLKNFGQTPARNVRFNVAWASGPPPFPAELHKKVITDADGRGSIGPGMEFFAGVATHVFSEKDKTMSHDEIGKILDGKSKFWIFGVIEYDDVFGSEHRTRFRHYMYIYNGNVGFSPCAEGNEET